MAEVAEKPWAERKAWLVGPGYAVSGARLLKVCFNPKVKGAKPPCLPTDTIGGRGPNALRKAALVFAREQGIKKLGPPPADKLYWNVCEGGFQVRGATCLQGHWFVVEGPPNERGELPCWRESAWGPGVGARQKKAVKDVPGLFELVTPKEKPE